VVTISKATCFPSLTDSTFKRYWEKGRFEGNCDRFISLATEIIQGGLLTTKTYKKHGKHGLIREEFYENMTK
jgi:hypothetical protein